MSPEVLASVLEDVSMQSTKYDRVITGLEDNEDAAVLSIPTGMAVIQTVDFFTPIVNDPYHFGRIAAANALSDVYVMGGTPWSAMNLVMFPDDELPLDILTEILRGGSDALKEADAPLVGGHSISDTSIKYGLSVSGIIDPACIAKNSGLMEGDILILTKPLGTGILVTAIKNELEQCDIYEKSLIYWASKLNKGASTVIQELGIKACTDITGFGLGGHVLEMAKASHKSIELDSKALPFIDGVQKLLLAGIYPGGSAKSLAYAKKDITIAEGIEEMYIKIAFDAQTSGGALLAVKEKKIKKVFEILAQFEDVGYIVGRVREKTANNSFLHFS